MTMRFVRAWLRTSDLICLSEMSGEREMRDGLELLGAFVADKGSYYCHWEILWRCCHVIVDVFSV